VVVSLLASGFDVIPPAATVPPYTLNGICSTNSCF
jgi:hypothetical protein